MPAWPAWCLSLSSTYGVDQSTSEPVWDGSKHGWVQGPRKWGNILDNFSKIPFKRMYGRFHSDLEPMELQWTHLNSVYIVYYCVHRYLLSIVFWIVFPYNFRIVSSVSNKLAYLWCNVCSFKCQTIDGGSERNISNQAYLIPKFSTIYFVMKNSILSLYSDPRGVRGVMEQLNRTQNLHNFLHLLFAFILPLSHLCSYWDTVSCSFNVDQCLEICFPAGSYFP